ncbi:MAG: ROK family protein [SAR116 cluster bacterium]|nr:MAG: ROK family protein [SAR116 cluster bacterium]
MSAGTAIAIDLGGTQLRVALVEGNRLLDRAALPTDTAAGPAGIFGQIDQLIDRLIGQMRADIAGIGMSCAGPIDTDTGTVTDIPTLPGWDGFPLADELSRRTGLAVRVENDGIAAALGEWHHGAGQSTRNMVYLTVSTGIGGGAVVDGRLLRGHKGIAGHIGHMKMAQDGPVCHCGVVGCFEALASGTAMKQRAMISAGAATSPYLVASAQGGAVDARDVFDGARAGDAHCLHLVAEEAMYLGQGITSAIHMFSPERVVLGGGLSHGFDLLAPGIHDVIRRDAMMPFRTVPVVAATLGDDSGLMGAASLILDAQEG